MLQIASLCHCIIRWEKYKNSRPIQQCYNCQAFGHSSTFCGKTPKCVKCELTHATRDCTKPIGTPPKCTNCEGPHPANFTGCPRYLLQLQHQQQNPQRPQPPSQIPKQTPTSFKYRQNHSLDIKASAHPSSPQPSWAQIASRNPQPKIIQPPNSVADTIKSLLELFDYQKLYVQLRTLITQLQESQDSITKLVAVVETIINCFFTTKHP